MMNVSVPGIKKKKKRRRHRTGKNNHEANHEIRDNVSETVKRFGIILRADGLIAAMRWLNDRVPYRYSAVFSFDGDILHNVCLVDKNDPVWCEWPLPVGHNV
jgi:hypothetical protein